jgi:hypothetical protein
MTRTRIPSVIPAGYTFLNPNTFMSQKGYDKVRDLLRKADNRNPDLFHMYIYNGTSHHSLASSTRPRISILFYRIIA